MKQRVLFKIGRARRVKKARRARARMVQQPLFAARPMQQIDLFGNAAARENPEKTKGKLLERALPSARRGTALPASSAGAALQGSPPGAAMPRKKTAAAMPAKRRAKREWSSEIIGAVACGTMCGLTILFCPEARHVGPTPHQCLKHHPSGVFMSEPCHECSGCKVCEESRAYWRAHARQVRLKRLRAVWKKGAKRDAQRKHA